MTAATTVLVTGGRGFVGGHLASRLRSNGVEVLTPARADLDLNDFAAVSAYLQAKSVDTIVHLASCLDRREESSVQEQQWSDTFAAGRCLFWAAGASGVKRVVAAGSMDEVGLTAGMVDAASPLSPSSTYGLCKSLVLQTAQYVSKKEGLQVEWFRPTAVYGPGQKGPMLIPAAFASALLSGEADFTSGEQKRDFIFVGDLVDWIAQAMALPHEAGTTVHHVGAGTPVPVKDVLHRVADLTGAQFRLGTVPRRAGEPDLFGVPPFADDRSPLKAWSPQTSLDQGLEQTFHWWRDSAAASDA